MLFRLVNDHFRAFHAACEDRSAATYGDRRLLVREGAAKFVACGALAHGFARVRCDARTHEGLLALSCKARYFCPSCHAKRLGAERGDVAEGDKCDRHQSWRGAGA